MAGGCHSACVTFTLPPHYHSAATDPNGPDTIYFERGGSPKVLVAQAGSTSVSDPEVIRIRYSRYIVRKQAHYDRATGQRSMGCDDESIAAHASPGQEGIITVVFKAPEIQDVRKKFTLPGMELKYPDLIKIIDPDGCEKDVPLKAVVDTLPECKEFDLSVYGFVGSQNVIYREAYGFDVGREDNVVQGGTPGFPSSGRRFSERLHDIQ